MDFSAVRNPCYRIRGIAVRDPAVLQVSGAFHLFYTAYDERRRNWRIGACATLDFDYFTTHHLISPAGYASPGNVIQVGDSYWLCVQSYDLTPEERPAGREFPGDACRLWWLKSDNLMDWSEPAPLNPAGCTSAWAGSPRQIDPYVFAAEAGYYLYFKSQGALGCWFSDDLQTWRDLSPDRPVLSQDNVQCGATVENPCVIHDGERYRLYYSPCRPGRGLCWAVSDDLVHWTDQGELPTDPTWAAGGFTAHVVTRAERGKGSWLMLFHGEQCDPDHPETDAAALGLAWSDDLTEWHFG